MLPAGTGVASQGSRARRSVERPEGSGGLRRPTCRSALRGATGGGRSRAPRPTREPAAAPCSVPRTAASAAAANPAQAGKPHFHILLGFFSPSCLILSDGLRSPGGISMAGGPAAGSEASRGRPTPQTRPRAAQPAGPSLAGGRTCTTAAPSRSRRQPEWDVSSSGNDGEGVTVAAVGQRV